MQSWSPGTTPSVLVLEDDPAIGRGLSRNLRQAGYQVELVERCARVRDLNRRFDVAVLDLELPDGVSLDMAAELLALGATRAVVFFSGASDALLLSRAARFGEVVSKSASFAALLEAIESTQFGPTSEWRQLIPQDSRSRSAGG